MGRDGHLEETLRRILAETLSNGIDDPRVGFVTISEVRLNRDRSVAEVYYTVLGDEAERRTCLKGLKRAKGFLRGVIGENTRMRTLPDLRFVYDESLDRSFRVEAILDDIREVDSTEESSSSSGSDAEAASGDDDA